MRRLADIFDRYGFLSPGPNLYIMDAMKADFVDAFPESVRRPAIFDGLVALRNELLCHGLVGFQYIDGSFVTGKQEPNDVDVVTFIDHDMFNASSSEAKAFVRQVLEDENRAKAEYMTHAAFVACCAMTHAHYAVYASLKQYWVDEFSRVKEMPYGMGNPRKHRKGYVYMPLGI